MLHNSEDTVQLLFWDSVSQSVHGEATRTDTRWACQYSTLWAIKRTCPAILATLVAVSNQTNPHRATEARLLIGLIDAHFVLHICMLESIFSLTKNLSDDLQATDFELASAADLIFAVVDAFYDKRDAETWTKI